MQERTGMGSTVERAFHSARKRCRASQGVVHRLRQGAVILYLASWWVYHTVEQWIEEARVVMADRTDSNWEVHSIREATSLGV